MTKIDFRAMGTDISIEVNSDIVDTEIKLKKAQNIFNTNEEIFSRFKPTSELNLLNQNLNQEIKISTKMFEILEFCLEYHNKSQGIFDPRIINNLEKIGYNKDFNSHNLNQNTTSQTLEIFHQPLDQELILNKENITAIIKHKIDTTGLVKGYTVDEVVRYLKENDLTDFIVDAGGDMFAKTSTDNPGWIIDVEGATDKNLNIKLANLAIATSGISRKKWQISNQTVHHLINPTSPNYFSEDIISVTTIAAKTIEADYLAKTIFIMGQKNGYEFAQKNNLPVLFLLKNGQTLLTDKMKEYLWTS